VTTVCPGPAAGRTGPVAGGQTLAVARGPGRDGYTGPFTAIYAWFVPPSGTTTAPTQLKFESYARTSHHARSDGPRTSSTCGSSISLP